MFQVHLMVARSTSSSGLMDCTLEEANSLGLYGFKVSCLDIRTHGGYRSYCFSSLATTIEDVRDNLPFWENRVFTNFEGIFSDIFPSPDAIILPEINILTSNKLGLEGYSLNSSSPVSPYFERIL